MTNYGSNPEPPGNYPNPRNNDPWDDDAVRWLLEHLDVYERFTYGVLFECLREQPNKLNGYPERVAEAERLARKHGVVKLAGKPIRLIRTDADAPKYPAERRSEAPKSLNAKPRIDAEPGSGDAP